MNKMKRIKRRSTIKLSFLDVPKPNGITVSNNNNTIIGRRDRSNEFPILPHQLVGGLILLTIPFLGDLVLVQMSG